MGTHVSGGRLEWVSNGYVHSHATIHPTTMLLLPLPEPLPLAPPLSLGPWSPDTACV